MTGAIAAVVEQIADDPAILGLGDLEVIRTHSCRAGQATLLLEDRASRKRYIVDLQIGPADDRQVIRLLERWATERKRHARSRCFALLIAEQIEPRYRDILRAISKAIPVLVMNMQEVDGGLQSTPLGLR